MGFGEVEAVLAAVHHIAAAKRTAFQARLKNFHRLGFPTDLKGGRGKAAKYKAHHMFLMAVALELSQLGVAPDRAVKTLNENIGVITRAIRHTLRREGDEYPEEWSPMVLYFNPNALAELADERSNLPVGPMPFWFEEVSHFSRELNRWFNRGEVSRLSMISVTGLLVNIEAHIGATQAFLNDLLNWAEREGPKHEAPPPVVLQEQQTHEEFDFVKLRNKLFPRRRNDAGKREIDDGDDQEA